MAELLEQMEANGARFTFTRPGGSLIVKGLGRLPGALVERFLTCDAGALVMLVKAKQGVR